MIEIEKNFKFFLIEKKRSVKYDLEINPNKKISKLKKNDLIMSFLYKLLKKNKESFPELTLKNEDNFKFEEEKKQITEKELIEN